MYSKNQERHFYDQSKRLLSQGLSDTDILPNDQHARLVELINYHEWKYYVQNDPVISDFEYDQLFKQLEALEEEHPSLISPVSPTQRVSSDLTSSFNTVKHLSAMLSLANSYNAEDLQSFDDSVRKLLSSPQDEDIAYTVEPKFDGGSIALVYEDDQLVRAATRGNGQEGDEMTLNARTIRSIPLQAEFLKHGVGRIELRGEAIIPKLYFEKINRGRAEAGLPLFANPRNVATGGLRTKDPHETAKRGIETFIYQISYVENLAKKQDNGLFMSQWEGMQLLQQLGFKVPTKQSKKCNNIKEVISFCQMWETQRDSYPY
ncbi:MAG: DNA ligase (NAD(+)) LigA, partial [Saprospiraceae bacterium]|nr:DNA ligase (NAD(+)) LigA [Saprospiraceae bacterium]